MPIAKRKPLAPVDDSVKIPAAVLAAGAAADALHQRVYEAPAEPGPEDSNPAEKPVAEKPVAEKPVAEKPAEGVLSPESQLRPTDKPVAEKSPDSAPTPLTPAEPQPQAPSDQSWEHRYLSMKGRFDRSEQANRALNERLTGLEQVIATMTVAASETPVVEPAGLITADERAAYGDEFIDMAGKIARHQWAPKVEELEKHVKNLSDRLESVGGVVAQTERQQMHARMNESCPKWLEVNDNPDFMNWLALPDPYSGAIRHKLLTAAYAANDAPRVLAFFQGFLSEEAASTPRSEPALTPPAPPAPKVPLETFAAPGRAKTAAAPPAPAEKPSFTRAEVSQFYVDVASKKYVGREAEKDRIDRSIVDAGREGRIR